MKHTRQSSESADRDHPSQNPTTTRNPRRMLAFFGPGMKWGIARALWPGLLDEARAHDVNLLYIAGESLSRPPDFRQQANALYDLFDPMQVDGLICWTSVLDSFVPPEELTAFLARYAAVPMVSVGKIIEGMPSLVMDSYQGMYAAVEHLIDVHGARRLAFIRGPENSFYAQERYRAYKEALDDHGLTVDPALITPPYWWNPSYRAEAVHLLLDERGLQPGTTLDAVVSVNDKMALGSIQALQARGLRVPHDLAVIGFNDDPGSRFNTPSLTSVKAPLYELGAQAIDLLLTLISGASVPDRVDVRARLIVRQSCGCVSLKVTQAAAGVLTAQEARGKHRLTVSRDPLLADMTQALEMCEEASTWAEQVLNACLDELGEGRIGAFLSTLTEGLRHTATGGGNMEIWHAALSCLRRHMLPSLETPEMVSRAEDLWQQARTEIGDAEKRQQGAQELQRQQQTHTLRDLGATLLTTFDVAGLMDTLFAGLPRVGIPGCYLALYDDPHAPANGARLRLAYDKQGRLELETDGRHATAFGSIPEDMVFAGRRSTFIVEALYFQEEQIGFVLFEAEAIDGTVYEILRGEISSALQGALLVQRVQQRSAELARKQYILDTFIETIPDRIWFKDREGRLTRANRAHALGLGLEDPREEIGKTDADFYGVEVTKTQASDEQEILRTGQPMLNKEVSRTEPDGSQRWSLVTKMPLLDENQNIIGTFGISRDVTALKHAQEELQKHAHELAAAYEEIRILNDQLHQENVRMGAELDVSRRIQQMMLPSPQELKQVPELDIVGYMQPADEVGGDYYDVLQQHGALSENRVASGNEVASGNGVAYIGIGDVTGHGLESGLLMLMTQTAIRTLLEHGETDPAAFVNTLNRTIYQNVQRMGVDKTLTFVLLHYQEGHLKVVGQHEEILVVRADGRIERLDTLELGFPVGLEPEIQQWVQEASIHLAPGDGVVLYTDGITEAANLANDLYGIERLCEVVSQHWEAPADAIKQAVIDDVTRHIGKQKVYDDLTLVVLKHM